MNASSFKTMPLRSALAGAVLIALVGGCSTMSAPNATLDRAHAGYRALQADQQAAQAVPTEMAQADEALRAADAAWTQREQAATIEHLAYLAQQRVAIARETAATRTLEKAAAATKTGADADRARTDLAAAKQNTQDKTIELALTKAGAQQDRARATDLEAQLREINAKQTDRGDIVSLGDVLFESNRAEMSVSGRRDMSRLVAFMKQHPKRAALIEGFTDSQGGQAANVDLSQRRAMAVRDALVEQGVFADRLSTHGYGDAHPVASNATAAGRQMNRRVEIVLSRDDTMAKGR